MAYGIKYTCNFYDYFNRLVEVKIYEDDFTGSSTTMIMGPNPVRLSEENQNAKLFHAIRARICNIELVPTTNSQYDALLTNDFKKFVLEVDVTYSSGKVTIFYGFINGSLSSKSYTSQKYIFNLTAVDPLCYLKNLKYRSSDGVYFGVTMLSNVINKCLGKIGISYNIYESIGVREQKNSTYDTDQYSPLDMTYVDQEVFLGNSIDKQIYNLAEGIRGEARTNWKPVYEPDTCYEVIEKILNQFAAYIYFYNDNYYIERLGEVYTEDTYVARTITSAQQTNYTFFARATTNITDRYVAITGRAGSPLNVPINNTATASTVNTLKQINTSVNYDEFITNVFKKGLIEGEFYFLNNRFSEVETYATRSGSGAGTYVMRKDPASSHSSGTLYVNLYDGKKKLLPLSSGVRQSLNNRVTRDGTSPGVGVLLHGKYEANNTFNIRIRIKLRTDGGRTYVGLFAREFAPTFKQWWLSNTSGWVNSQADWLWTDGFADTDNTISLPSFVYELELLAYIRSEGDQVTIYDEFSIEVVRENNQSIEYSLDINADSLEEENIKLPFLEEQNNASLYDKSLARLYRNWLLIYNFIPGSYPTSRDRLEAASAWTSSDLTLSEILNNEYSRLRVRQRYKIRGSFLSEQTPFNRVKTSQYLFFITSFDYNVKKGIWTQVLEEVDTRGDAITQEDEQFIVMEDGTTYIGVE